MKFQPIPTRYNGSKLFKSTLIPLFLELFGLRFAYFWLKLAQFTKGSTRTEGNGSGSFEYVNLHQKWVYLSLVPSACRCVRPLGSNIKITLSIANFGPVSATETYNTSLESSWKISKNEYYCKTVTNMYLSQIAKNRLKMPKKSSFPHFWLISSIKSMAYPK